MEGDRGVVMLAGFEGVDKGFGSTRALRGLSFGVPESSVCGLLGPNGWRSDVK